VFTAHLVVLKALARRFKFAPVLLSVVCALLLASGCERIRSARHDKVYVSARNAYLRDRVAAVSNRVGEVTNGQELEVLDHGRRFLKVKTQKKEIGWIEERAVIDAATYDSFLKLADQYRKNPVVATAGVRDDIYMHVRPGRDTDRFYLLAADAKVQLLARASVPKTGTQTTGTSPLAQAPKSSAAGSNGAAAAKAPAQPSGPAKSSNAGNQQAANKADQAPATEQTPIAPVAMEDWWLARDSQGHTGWLLGNRVDVDVPDEVGTYSEGQRIVGVYRLANVVDSEANTPNHQVSEYVMVLNQPKSGLPYDFDQVRVFTWSLKRHRYETAFRQRGLRGYLPMTIGSQVQRNTGTSTPTFTFQIAGSDNVITDPQTSITRPAAPRTISYVMLDTVVRRTGSDLGPIPITQSDDDKAKAAKAGKGAKAGKKQSR
jgi:hypothetical protein